MSHVIVPITLGFNLHLLEPESCNMCVQWDDLYKQDEAVQILLQGFPFAVFLSQVWELMVMYIASVFAESCGLLIISNFDKKYKSYRMSV